MQHTVRSQGHSLSSPSPPLSLSVSHSHIHTQWGQYTHFLSKLYSYFWGLPMTSRQMKRGSSARRRQSNVPQSNYKGGAGGRIDAVYQLMLLLGVPPPTSPPLLQRLTSSNCPRAKSGRYWPSGECWPTIMCGRMRGWVTERWDKGGPCSNGRF